MVDASNILRFEGVGNVDVDIKYAVELWIFKPQKSGQQVGPNINADKAIANT